MTRRRDALGGGRLVALASLLLLGMSALILWQAGTGEPGLRMWVRATARTSLLLFGAVFTASSLRALWRTPATAWLLRNRRYLGLSFAVSHGLHLISILGLSLLLGDAFEVDVPTIVGGGGAYLMIALMAATSSDRAYAWLGRHRWHLLHKIGVYWIWIIFANSYTARAVVAVASGKESLSYLPVALFVWTLLGLRIAAGARARSARAATAAIA